MYNNLFIYTPIRAYIPCETFEQLEYAMFTDTLFIQAGFNLQNWVQFDIRFMDPLRVYLKGCLQSVSNA